MSFIWLINQDDSDGHSKDGFGFFSGKVRFRLLLITVEKLGLSHNFSFHEELNIKEFSSTFNHALFHTSLTPNHAINCPPLNLPTYLRYIPNNSNYEADVINNNTLTLSLFLSPYNPHTHFPFSLSLSLSLSLSHSFTFLSRLNKSLSTCGLKHGELGGQNMIESIKNSGVHKCFDRSRMYDVGTKLTMHERWFD